MLEHHSYYRLFTKNHADTTIYYRCMIVTSMVTENMVVLFLLALFYDLNSPVNDEYFQSLDTKESCLKVNHHLIKPRAIVLGH